MTRGKKSVLLPPKADPSPDDEAGSPKHLIDYISGLRVRATREEREAVQVFARRLVEDFGYPKGRIQTHPQFRVRLRPSDEGRSFPVDIAVFSSNDHVEGNLILVVEGKAPEKTKGVGQLQRYLEMSPADIGVWFNGRSHAYVHKLVDSKGRVTWEELPNIPRFGQRVEDIGQFKRQALVKPSDLRAVFRDLRNHLAGSATGITLDQKFAQEIINLLFCKIYDELNTAPDEVVTFRCGLGEAPFEVQKRLATLFDNVKREYADVFDPKDSIELDADSLIYVVGELQAYCVTEADRDAVGDAFEVFIGPALRGQEGQFFTPRNVVRMMVEMIDPRPGEMILDPACGSGGFLISSLEHVWRAVELEGDRKHWSKEQITKRKLETATRSFRGVDKDAFLAKVTKAYMAIVGDGRGGIFCANSLEVPSKWGAAASKLPLEGFDVCVTNPPFGKRIRVQGEALLGQYHLGHKWKRDKGTGKLTETDAHYEHQPPQIIFLERCLQFLKPGGRLGIVLPEAVVGMPTYEYVVEFLRAQVRILAVISMPEALFKTSGKGGTHAKTCVLLLRKVAVSPKESYPFFMADAKWCGHDSRGNPTIRIGPDGKPVVLDDVPLIALQYKRLVTAKP